MKSKIVDKTVQHIKLPYTSKRISIGKKDMSKFVKTKNRRDIREGKAKKLLNVCETALKKNGSVYLAGVFSINIKKEKWRMIDCNHRVEALEEFFARHPNATMDIEFQFHKDLSEAEERKVFDKVNNITQQTTSDHLKVHWIDINIQKKINNDENFPLNVSHKNTDNELALHSLYLPYLTKDDEPYNGAFNGHALEFIDEIKSWNTGNGSKLTKDGEDAFLIMKAFVKDFVEAFGKYTKSNVYWKQPVLFPIFRIWYDSKGSFTKNVLVKRFKDKLTNGGAPTKTILDWKSMGAPRGNCIRAVRCYLTDLNMGIKRINNQVFIKDKVKGTDGQGNPISNSVRVMG